MSYRFELPPRGPIPAAALRPPYVLIGINSKDVWHDLPPEIPLALLIHFAPKTQRWILPEPTLQEYTKLPTTSCQDLVKQYVGRDSQLLIASTPRLPVRSFVSPYIRPGYISDFPLLGSMHCTITSLSCSRVVRQSLNPKCGIYGTLFPAKHPVRIEMGLHFVRCYVDRQYTDKQVSGIRRWYLSTKELCDFFSALENRVPHFARIQQELIAEAIRAEQQEKKRLENAEKEKVRREKVKKRREERQESLDSLRSTITEVFDPSAQKEKEEKSDGSLERSKKGRRKTREERRLSTPQSEPVDHSALSAMLEKIAMDQDLTTEKAQTKAQGKPTRKEDKPPKAVI